MGSLERLQCWVIEIYAMNLGKIAAYGKSTVLKIHHAV
jgi:hypothetical protein